MMRKTFILIILLITTATTVKLLAQAQRRGGSRSQASRGSSIRTPSRSRASRPPGKSRHIQRPQDSSRSINPRERFQVQGKSRAPLKEYVRTPVNEQRSKRGDIQQKRERIGKNAHTSRRNISERYPHAKEWFNDNFWSSHNYYPHYPVRHIHWHRRVDWATVYGWIPWAYAGYYYYDNGYAYFPKGTTYQSVEIPKLDYFQLKNKIFSYTDEEDTKEEDWLPLGVYALTNSSYSAAAPNMYLQLTLNKNGRIAGTFYNSTSDGLYPIDGYVDAQTQRAVFSISGPKHTPILETGIYNLTQDQTSIQVRFPSGLAQEWQLIRMEDP